MLVSPLKRCNVSRQTTGVDAKTDIPENRKSRCAGFLLCDYRTRICRSPDFCELLSCRNSGRSRPAICAYTFSQNLTFLFDKPVELFWKQELEGKCDCPVRCNIRCLNIVVRFQTWVDRLVANLEYFSYATTASTAAFFKIFMLSPFVLMGFQPFRCHWASAEIGVWPKWHLLKE